MAEAQSFFVPLTKVDQKRREVWGYAATEEPDKSDEIMDYETSKPYWLEWSNDFKKRSGGLSLGNLRAMHKDIAAGKLIDFRPDDKNKGIWVGAQVVDDNEWKKVEAGVYTGFSVGGHYVKKWYDAAKNKTRYTAQPVELSLVDSPCIPTATFQMVKLDGSEEAIEFHPGNGENLLKAIPDSPEAVGSIPVPVFTVERIPDPNEKMQISPSDPPSGETLASRVFNVEELISDAEKIISGGNSENINKLVARLTELTKMLTKWQEGDHPRAEDGKFTSKGGGSGSSESKRSEGSESKSESNPAAGSASEKAQDVYPNYDKVHPSYKPKTEGWKPSFGVGGSLYHEKTVGDKTVTVAFNPLANERGKPRHVVYTTTGKPNTESEKVTAKYFESASDAFDHAEKQLSGKIKRVKKMETPTKIKVVKRLSK